MEVYGFNLDDFKILETLLQISTEISNIYDELCELEIKNQKDSKEYRELLTKLHILIKKENIEYQKKQFTYDDCMKYLRLLESKTSIPGMDNRITTSLKHYENRIIRRIMINILNILDKNKDFHQKVIDNGLANAISNIIENLKTEDLVKSVGNSAQIQTALDNDIHSMFLSILEESISYKNNEKYRNELIQAKYCILYTHKNMESMFIHSSFNIPDEVYTSSKMINQLLNQAEMAYRFIKFMKLKSEARQDINVLLTLNDSEYEKHNIFFSSIIITCHIRALLSLMEDRDVNDFNQEIHDILESPKYLEKHQNDRISESIVINSFKYFKNDKAKARILSTKG
ncbi:MAG: hypothetical protein IJE89_01255 [Bacilli bacterium]|nr:hypothetical protein [Bacilli bacterium]